MYDRIVKIRGIIFYRRNPRT
jgi:hypothetical protein